MNPLEAAKTKRVLIALLLAGVVCLAILLATWAGLEEINFVYDRF